MRGHRCVKANVHISWCAFEDRNCRDSGQRSSFKPFIKSLLHPYDRGSLIKSDARCGNSLRTATRMHRPSGLNHESTDPRCLYSAAVCCFHPCHALDSLEPEQGSKSVAPAAVQGRFRHGRLAGGAPLTHSAQGLRQSVLSFTVCSCLH